MDKYKFILQCLGVCIYIYTYIYIYMYVYGLMLLSGCAKLVARTNDNYVVTGYLSTMKHLGLILLVITLSI